MNFGEKLRELREKKGMSQKAVAEELNITLRTYASYELNQRRPRTQAKLDDIAKFYDVTADYLQIDDIAEKTPSLERYGRKEAEKLSRKFESDIVNIVLPFMEQLGWNVKCNTPPNQSFDLLATINDITIFFEFKYFLRNYNVINSLYMMYGTACALPLEKTHDMYFVVISNTKKIEDLAKSHPPVNLKIPIKFFSFNQEKNKFDSTDLFKFISRLSQ